MRLTATAARKNLEVDGVPARILAAARTEFSERGLRAASVHRIGARAGVTAAMINYYFGGKRALYDAVVAEAQGRLSARLARAMAAGGDAGLAARLAGAYFDFLAEERELPRLLLREVLDQGPGVGKLARRYVQPLRALLERHFGGDDEAVQLAVSVFGAVAGYFLYEPVLGPFLGQDPRSPDALAARRRHVVRLAARLEKGSR